MGICRPARRPFGWKLSILFHSNEVAKLGAAFLIAALSGGSAAAVHMSTEILVQMTWALFSLLVFLMKPIAEICRIDGKRVGVTAQMIDHAQVGEAIAYLDQFIKTPPPRANLVRLADVHYVLAVLLESQQQKDRAIAVFRNGRRHNPNDFRIRSALGRLLGEIGQPGEASIELAAAIELNPAATKVRMSLAIALIQNGQVPAAADHLKRVLEQEPGDALALFHLANCQRIMKDWDSAVSNYRAALKANPNMLLAANNLAFIRAAHPQSRLRDGKLAMALAKRICERTEFRHPSFLDTLAIAYAENGQFDKAIDAAQQAIELLRAQPDTEHELEEIRAHLELFKNGRVFRESW